VSQSIYIAGASGFWGDSDAATAQLVKAPQLDYIVYDYLSEITLALLARARAVDPDRGFIPDFERAILPHLAELKRRGIKLLANAGGLNPVACARSLEAKAAAAGVPMKIAAVSGDDVMDKLSPPLADMFSGDAIPTSLMSANAYLGVSGIVAALETGADIVVTGRCADSALTLAPLIHKFGWQMDDWDRLAQGSLAGHLIECGCQGAGGLFTDWRSVPGWEDMGYPIAVCTPDGSFEITKMEGAGGLISPLSVGEQMLYEIGDPADYRLPDVICDFRAVQLNQTGPDRVRVSGTKGRPAPTQYKVSVTWQAGWRITATLMIGGAEAVAKARRVGEAILARAARLGAEQGVAPFTQTSVEVIGAEDSYGPHACMSANREVVLKIAAASDNKAILSLLSKEIFPSATAMSPGITGAAAGRPKPAPVIRGGGVLIPRDHVEVMVHHDGKADIITVPDIATDTVLDTEPAEPSSAREVQGDPFREAPTFGGRLLDYAVARSGDKGNLINVGVLARDETAWEFLRENLTATAVADWLGHLGASRVERFGLPGSRSLNFVLHDALNGGGMANLKMDAQGKAVAQMLLDLPLSRLCHRNGI
jgi:hypothetical protein